MTTPRTWKIAALAASLTLAACGGSMPKSPAEEPLPASTDDTLAVLDHAEADLRVALGEPGGSSFASPPGVSPAQGQPSATSSPAAGAAPAPPPPPALAPADKGAARVEADAPANGSGASNDSPCINACRALASMARATEHLCGLTGSGDARCEGARTRVQSAGDRVRAHCPACS